MSAQVQVTLTDGRKITISDISFFEDQSVGIGLCIDGYTARYDDTGEEIEYNVSDEDEKIIDDAIWKTYYENLDDDYEPELEDPEA